MPTKIPWADEVWSPVTGCSPVSDGCKNCYARRMAQRLKGRFGYPEDNPFRVTFHPDRLDRPARWTRPRRIFVCSMGDLFHKDVRPEHIDRVFEVMTRDAPHHTYMLLTKRPQRITAGRWDPNWKNIWLGFSVENQPTADERIPVLLRIPAAVRFVSYEPALGPLEPKFGFWLSHLDWFIAGCESGPGRREANIDWFRSVRDQCLASEVPFFLIQMEIDGAIDHMPSLDGRVWDQVPEGET